MDEEVASRSPPGGASPKAPGAAPAAAGGPAGPHALLSGKAFPVTPVALAGPGASFSSPISTAASLGASLESMSLAGEGEASRAGSGALPAADSAAFLGPASYFPAGFYRSATGLKPKGPGGRGAAAGRRRRHRAGPTSRLRKSNGQVRGLGAALWRDAVGAFGTAPNC